MLGKTVILNSGGPIMTVTQIDDGDTVCCFWSEKEQAFEEFDFPIEALTCVDEDEDEDTFGDEDVIIPTDLLPPDEE